MLKVLYAVVTSDGSFKRGNSGFHVYARRRTAEGWANRDGDCVVELVWDTDREPLHIKSKKVAE